MNERETGFPTAEERRAQEAVRELGVPRADPEFRARLGDEFVSGQFEPRPARIQHLPWPRRPMTHWTLAAAAAAAAVAAVLMLNEGPDWRIVSQHGYGTAMVDGQSVSLERPGDLERALHGGAHLLMPLDTDLALRAGGMMLISIEPGSEITLPSVPGRWFARAARGGVTSGEVRFTTGEAFHGATLALATPEARVGVTGTTFAVICESTGTCVCVLEGKVRVGAARGAPMEIPGGRRGYVFADGRPPLQAAMRPDEEPKLRALREAQRGTGVGPSR